MNTTHRSSIRWASTLLLSVGLFSGLSACEKKTPAPTPAPVTPAPAVTPAEAPKTPELPAGHPDISKPAPAPVTPAAAGAKKYTFGVIAKSQGNPVFQAARIGAMDAGKELSKDGVEVSIDWRTPNNEDAQQQAQYIEQLVTSGVDGIAISVSDAKVLTSAIDSAVEKGVPVVCFDSDAPDSKRFAMYGMDDFESGQKLGEQMAKALGDTGDKSVKGVVAILAGNQNATNLQNRVRGVKDALAKYKNITIKDTYYHVEDAVNAAAKVQQVQNANPDITGWAMVGGWPLFSDNALAGVADKAKVVAIDIVDTELVYVKNGQVQMLVGQNCWGWGNESVKILYDFVHNGKKPATPIIKAPVDIVTKDNVAEFEGMWKKWTSGK
ncbi:MAG TPA: sugar-binding protein [Phycisphaerales bacterium]|nr:sugar-binding protein [Phycisphaerales bacterium]